MPDMKIKNPNKDYFMKKNSLKKWSDDKKYSVDEKQLGYENNMTLHGKPK